MIALFEAIRAAADWSLVFGGISALASVAATVIAIRVWLVAKDIRTLDWYRSQNDAWNNYNAQKLGPSAPAFEAIDALTRGSDRYGPTQTIVCADMLHDYAHKSVLFQRLNILERDFKAIALKLVDGADGHYVINEIKSHGANAWIIINFMIDMGYDPDFTMFYRRAACWFAKTGHKERMSNREARRLIKLVRRDRRRGSFDDYVRMEGPEGL